MSKRVFKVVEQDFVSLNPPKKKVNSPVSPNIDELPGCCGVAVVNGFIGMTSGLTPEHIEAFNSYLKDPSDINCNDSISEYGLGLIALTSDQTVAKKLILKAGWFPLVEFTNPKHQSRITLYGFDPNNLK